MKLTAAVVPEHWLSPHSLLPPSLQAPAIFLMQACTVVACRVVLVFQRTLCRGCLPCFSCCCLCDHGMLCLGSCSASSQLADVPVKTAADLEVMNSLTFLLHHAAAFG